MPDKLVHADPNRARVIVNPAPRFYVAKRKRQEKWLIPKSTIFVDSIHIGGRIPAASGNDGGNQSAELRSRFPRRLVAEYLKEHWGDIEIEHIP